MEKKKVCVSLKLILILILVLPGCVKENDCSQLSEEYFPNQVGNWWVYNRYDSLGMEKTTLRVDIVRDSIQKDGKSYRMWVFSKSNIYDTLFVRTTADSVQFYRYLEGFPVEVMLIPLAKDVWWTHPFMVRDSTFVLSKDTLLINYRQYNDAYRVQRRLFAFNDYQTDTRWFIPHLGIAKVQNWHYLFGWISKENWDLENFSVSSKVSQ